MTGAHAFLAPSGAPQWGPGGCPASPKMQERYPRDEETPEAREGTAGHFYVSEALYGRPPAPGTLAPNGHPVTAEMIECGADYLRDIRDTLKAATPGTQVMVESTVSMGGAVHPLNWGTPDAFMVDRPAKRVHLWDYKYGHRYVDAFENWQCLDYLAGVMEADLIDESEWPQWSFTITVAQPRNYHPDGPLREWFFTGDKLVDYVARLKIAAQLATAESPALATGEQCRDCTARHVCPALQRVAMSMVDMSFTAQPVELPRDALGLELAIIRDAVKRLGARATGLEEQALSMLRTGPVPGWRAEHSKGREKWKDDTDIAELVTLGAMYDVDLAKPLAAITPNQARKAGIDADVIKAYAHTPSGGLALVRSDGTDAAKRFS